MKPFDGKRVVLWAEDKSELAGLERALVRLGSRVDYAACLADLRRCVEEGRSDLLAVRLDHPRAELNSLLRWLNQHSAAPHLLVVIDPWEQHLYLDALHQGAADGLVLPIDETELIRIGASALQTRRVHQHA